MQSSGFFEANQLSDGSYDRVYLASEFANYFSKFISNGVFANPTNQLQVRQSDDLGMSVTVNAGNAFINGFWFVSDTKEKFIIKNASGTLTRYDRIVVRYDLIERKISLVKLEGIPAVDPEIPDIQRTADYFDLCLCTIKIGAGVTTIYDKDITDDRPNELLCGFVASVVQVISTKDLFAQYESAFNVWFSDLKDRAGIDVEGFNVLFNAWFDDLKGKLSGDVATALSLRLDSFEHRMYDFESKTTTFSSDGRTINTMYSNGTAKNTVFDEDGRRVVTKMIDSNGMTRWQKVTSFREDGSIVEEAVINY